MNKSVLPLLSCLVLFAALASSAAPAVELHNYDFPERTSVDVTLTSLPAAPSARVAAKVVYKDGRARIDLSFGAMKPAVLFGGDITSYVLWAVTEGGDAENLGEVITRNKRDRLEFSTGKKSFGLMITAEPYYLIGKPSDLVLFTSVAGLETAGPTTAFQYADFGPEVRRGMDTIVHVKWDPKVALDLLQARKVLELAAKQDAETHAKRIYEEAQTAIIEADKLAADAPKSREVFEKARRAVALANEAINVSAHRIEALELERWVAEQRAEAEALEQRAAEAETMARQSRELAELARREVQQVQAERQRMTAETVALASEKSMLEQAMGQMRSEKVELQMATQQMQLEKLSMTEEFQTMQQEKLALKAEFQQMQQEKQTLFVEFQQMQQEKTSLQSEFERMRQEKLELEQMSSRLQQERDQANNRLQTALSHVAETTDSARGFVVNLPDILFDVGESTLKTDARLAIAKLAGILLILPGQRVTVEGHTDSTGSPEFNLALSERRANAVLDLLRVQGIDRVRLEATGFGMQVPVAGNDSAEGRRKNRRVEIVISSGTDMASN